ncbi:uncharacterized protein LOC114753935 [Neltuma alba]|uniref:uncharacterized protein LOC114753935 n=1 Tax=Neltuma alba TaxID=207710 RepID=UPI0010A3301A|nr:uncharacterized protein LOC114753935 [Prosopis alba]
MARMRLERFLKRPYKKLHACASGPFCISKKLGPNAYLLELPPNMSISLVFNAEDLVPYRGTFESHPLCSNDSAGPISRYLVRRKGYPDSDATWSTEDEFYHVDAALLNSYQLSNSPVASSSSRGEMMQI